MKRNILNKTLQLKRPSLDKTDVFRHQIFQDSVEVARVRIAVGSSGERGLVVDVVPDDDVLDVSGDRAADREGETSVEGLAKKGEDVATFDGVGQVGAPVVTGVRHTWVRVVLLRRSRVTKAARG